MDIPDRFLYMGLALLVTILLLYVFRRSRAAATAAPAYLDQVRQHVAAGDFKRAAGLQLRHGNKREAFNLLERGDVHDRAYKLAAELGLIEKAAMHAEQAGAFEASADYHAQAQNYEDAGRLYKRAGHFKKAAEAMEQAAGVEVIEIARMWENACLALMPSEQKQAMDPSSMAPIKELAEKAALAYQKAGDNERAATFFEMCQRSDEAKQLRTRSVSALKEHMTRVPFANQEHSPQAATPQMATPQMATPQVASDQRHDGPTDLIKEIHREVTPEQARALGGEPSKIIQREIVYVRDAVTNEETAVDRQNDRYDIGDKLGEGGMAVVFLATDTVLERPVALKFLPEHFTQNPTALAYFEREAKAAARLTHPNIVTIYDCGLMNDRPFISMELVKGKSIDSLLDALPKYTGLPISDALHIAEGLLTALDVAHQNKVIHRDIKPSNIMQTSDGLIKLMDFGIAGGLDPGKQTMVVGTPYYMAPEQFEGTGLDARTDLFAVGVTLYELLTGSLPYEARQHYVKAQNARALRPEIPEALDSLITQCINPDKEQRPASARQALEHIRFVHKAIQLSAAPQAPEQNPMPVITPMPSEVVVRGKSISETEAFNNASGIMDLPEGVQLEDVQRLSAMTQSLDATKEVPMDDETVALLVSLGLEVDPEEEKAKDVLAGDISKALEAYLNSDHNMLARMQSESVASINHNTPAHPIQSPQTTPVVAPQEK